MRRLQGSEYRHVPLVTTYTHYILTWQGALLAMAMVLVQQPTQRTAEFRTRIAKLAADKHEEIMCRCVPKS